MVEKVALLGAMIALPGALLCALGCNDDPVATTTGTTGGPGPTSTGQGGEGGSGGGAGGATTTTTGTASSTGSGGLGGAGGGGDTGGEGGSEPPVAIGKAGESCSMPGEKACAGHAQATQLVCGEDQLWAVAGTCPASERCSSAYGPKQGTCQAVLALCAGKSSNEVVCSGNMRVRCGLDLVSSVQLGACPFLCAAGACVGDCTPGAKQCAGSAPQTCSLSGTWASEAACPYACNAGQCTGVCVPGSGDCMGKVPLTCDPVGAWQAEAPCALGCNGGKCAGVCAPGGTRCAANTPEVCDPNGTWQAQPPCPLGLPACVAGACSAAPSCLSGAPGAGDTCGPNGNENCCASPLVPGGTYNRIQNANFPATISDFRMDRFEITVGRFRQFVNGYPANMPKEGDGAHSKIPGSGWSTMWNSSLPATHQDMILRLKNVGTNTWTNDPGPHESSPLDWLDYFMVFAFCAWDGGRLPTEAEWNYAAAGGSEQRYRPWGTMDLDSSYAVYDCTADGSPSQVCAVSDLPTVGSRSPKGDGRWGQADLVGGVWEWNLDWFHNPLPSPCVDCAALTLPVELKRSARGGSFSSAENRMNCVFRNNLEPDYRKQTLGGRCARNP